MELLSDNRWDHVYYNIEMLRVMFIALYEWRVIFIHNEYLPVVEKFSDI
jgi:hypothetical protein